MQNFRFSLEKILSWRRTELHGEEARLATLFAGRSRLDTARAEIRSVRDGSARRLIEAGGIDGTDLALLSGFLRRLENELIALDRQRAQSGEAILKQRAQVLEFHRRVRLLEKLKDRRLGEWRLAWQRETDSLASEAFLARWHRQ
jgi:flagellar export protein FliJ